IAVGVYGFGDEGASADHIVYAIHMDAADADRGVDPAGGLAGNLDSRFANPELHTQIRVSRLGNQLSYPEIDCGACYGGQLDAPVQLQVVQVTFVHFHMQALSATA